MSMYVQHNLSAMNANRMLGVTTSAQSKSTEKLTSGYRINRAADDAAGLAISEKMRGQIRGLNKASSNAQDGISMIQTAEGALTETHSIIQRMRELSVQAANDTNTDDDRTQIQNEIDQLTQEVDRIATTTEFNTKKLLDGSRTGAVNEKDGKAYIDSTFSNSTVSASITTDGTSKAAFSDVIRVEITKDFTEGQSTANTAKLSDADITNINTLLTSSTTAVTLDPVPGASTGTSVTNTGYAATKSTEENIAEAVDAVQIEIDTATATKTTSASAVASNDAYVATVVDSVYNFVAATTSSTAAGKNALASGVTKNDITSALNNYINALVDAGSVSGESANGSNTAILEAGNSLKALFDTTDTTNKASGATTAVSLSNVKKADNTNVTTAASIAATTANSTTLGTIGTNAYTALTDAAKQIAATQINDNINQAKIDQLEDFKTTLSDTDLSKAIIAFKEAETNYNALDSTTDTKDKIAEVTQAYNQAKADLDKLNVAGNVLTVNDLFGSTDDIKNFSIASKVDDDNKLTITMQNKSGDDTVITINNADKLKAGDVITITSEAMVESKQAATGKEALRLQIGANAGQEVALGINSMRAEALNLVQTKDGVEGKALDVTSQAGASMAVNAYDMALQKVSTERAKMGAMQNRLEHTISNLDTAAENTQNAESRVRDTDMASEMVTFSKNNILAQAGQSMLAQANQSTQGVLSLLG